MILGQNVKYFHTYRIGRKEEVSVQKGNQMYAHMSP